MERDVLTLCVVEGLSIRETATALKVAEHRVIEAGPGQSKARNLYREVSNEHAIDDEAVH